MFTRTRRGRLGAYLVLICITHLCTPISGMLGMEVSWACTKVSQVLLEFSFPGCWKSPQFTQVELPLAGQVHLGFCCTSHFHLTFVIFELMFQYLLV